MGKIDDYKIQSQQQDEAAQSLTPADTEGSSVDSPETGLLVWTLVALTPRESLGVGAAQGPR